MKKPSEQFSGGFSYLREDFLVEKADLPFQPPRINDSQLGNICPRLATLDETDRYPKGMLASGRGERSDKACVGAETSQDDAGTNKPISPAVLLGADIPAESAPP